MFCCINEALLARIQTFAEHRCFLQGTLVVPCPKAFPVPDLQTSSILPCQCQWTNLAAKLDAGNINKASATNTHTHPKNEVRYGTILIDSYRFVLLWAFQLFSSHSTNGHHPNILQLSEVLRFAAHVLPSRANQLLARTHGAPGARQVPSCGEHFCS